MARGSGPSLGPNQKLILRLLTGTSEGHGIPRELIVRRACNELNAHRSEHFVTPTLREATFGTRLPTSAQRAAIAKSIRRLAALGLVDDRFDELVLTPEGQAAADAATDGWWGGVLKGQGAPSGA